MYQIIRLQHKRYRRELHPHLLGCSQTTFYLPTTPKLSPRLAPGYSPLQEECVVSFHLDSIFSHSCNCIPFTFKQNKIYINGHVFLFYNIYNFYISLTFLSPVLFECTQQESNLLYDLAELDILRLVLSFALSFATYS